MSQVVYKKYQLKDPKKSILGIKKDEWWFSPEYGQSKFLRPANYQDLINATGIYRGENENNFFADKEGNVIPKECIIV